MTKSIVSTADVLQPFIEREELAGAVTLLADRDGIISLEAIGWADVQNKRPMQTDSMFWIASQTKPMTATVLMMLADEGRVALDDTVEKYLGEFAGQMFVAKRDEDHILLKKPLHPITLRNVLSHTSGLQFSSLLEHPTLDALPLRDAVRSYAMTPLQFEPDTDYLYSNQGTNTAARIAEVITGTPYAQLIQERLLDPLGMNDTTFWPNAEQVNRLAKLYAPGENGAGLVEKQISQLTYPLDDARRFAMPAGGLFSTASDISRFGRMIANGGHLDGKRLVSRAAVQEMTTRQTPVGLEGYGLGWALGESSFGHAGACSTNTSIDRKSGLISIWLVQHDGFPGQGDRCHDEWKQAALSRSMSTRAA